jgi:hypothetical protein
MDSHWNKFKAFLSLVEIAVQLGLELQEGAVPVDADIMEAKDKGIKQYGIWAYRYSLIDQNGYGAGHVMLQVYTKNSAELLKILIDESIEDTNPKRYTEISKHLSLYRIDNLQRFIKLRKEEEGL